MYILPVCSQRTWTGLGLESSDWTLQLGYDLYTKVQSIVVESSLLLIRWLSTTIINLHYTPESLPARPWKVAFPRTKSMVSFFPMVFWEGELLNFQGV